jgi:hypothetical protein
MFDLMAALATKLGVQTAGIRTPSISHDWITDAMDYLSYVQLSKEESDDESDDVSDNDFTASGNGLIDKYRDLI